MTSTRVFPVALNTLTAAGSIVALAMGGCGRLSLPGSSDRAASVPPQAVNEASVGVIRIRFGSTSGGTAQAQRMALDGWMDRHGLATPKLGYLLEQLDKGGYHTVLAVIPGDSAVLDDAGVYVGGPAQKGREDLEDVLIKVGGFSLGGVAAAKLQVLEIGNGWYYVGINGDGVIDGASGGKAGQFSEMLEDIGDRPACVALPVSELAASLDQITLEDQSRIARRLQGVADALAGASSLCASISPEGRSELLIVFPDEPSASKMEAAFARIRKDMELALQGSIEQGEISADEAERERRMIAAIRARQDGKCVVLYEE